MQKCRRIQVLILALFSAGVAILSGCRHDPPTTSIQIRDESGTVLANYSGVTVTPAGPGQWAIRVQDRDKVALEAVTRANLHKKLELDIAGLGKDRAVLMAPITGGTIVFNKEAASSGTANDLLKTFDPAK
ncbi:MAG: hypothetical protein JWO82_2374 [Akkermansiaceae bacterium]|nr:hypothetical protein [Akkermansiaceae bacterium]